jgi:hypothetical protein
MNKLKELLQTPVQINLEELQKANYKVQVATPIYGGLIHDAYQQSLTDAMQTLGKAGIQMNYSKITNDSLVTRARNLLVAMFLANKEATHLLFIDADIAFRGDYIIKMLWDMHQHNVDVITGAYSMKGINWQSIIDAVKNGHNDANSLQQQNNNFVINPKQNTNLYNGLIEVHDAGTGFMMISRSAIEKLIKAYPQLKFDNDVRMFDKSYTEHLYALFDTGIEGQGVLKHIKDSKRYLSEDYFFSRLCQKQKIKIYIDPRIQLGHIGQIIYQGDITNLYNTEDNNGQATSTKSN